MTPRHQDFAATTEPTSGPSTESAAKAPSRRGLLTGIGALAGAGLAAVATAPAAEASSPVNGLVTIFPPARIWDTRTPCHGGRISGGETFAVPYTGWAGTAFLVNLTVADTRGSGYLALYDGDLSTRPNPFSSINWQGDHKIVANFGVIALGVDGFNVYCGSSAGSTHFIIDFLGIVRTAPAAKQDQARYDQLLRDVATLRGC